MKINKEIRRRPVKCFEQVSLMASLIPAGSYRSWTRSSRESRAIALTSLQNYMRLLRLELEKRRARIETASEVDREASSKVIENLKKKYGNDLTTEFVVNPQLLGGMRIRVGSDVWDGTVRNRLERLQQQL